MNMDYDHSFRIVLCSKTNNVGKTALFERYFDNKFSDYHLPTTGASFKQRIIEIQNFHINLEAWDTCSVKRFRALNPLYYRNANLLVYCIPLVKDFDVQKNINFIKKIRSSALPDSSIIIVGTQLDLVNGYERKLSLIEGQQFAEKVGAIGYIECSAATGENVVEIFNFLTESLIDKILIGKDFASILTSLEKNAIENIFINIAEERLFYRELKMAKLANALAYNTSLTTLDLGLDIFLEKQEIDLLIQALTINTSLLNIKGLNSKQLEKIQPYLDQNESLKEGISDRLILDESLVKPVANKCLPLFSATNITHLAIIEPLPTEVFVQGFAALVRGTCALSDLLLYQQDMRKPALRQAMQELVNAPITLKYLEWVACSIDNEFIEQILPLWFEAPSMQSLAMLNLERNNIINVKPLISFLEKNKTLLDIKGLNAQLNEPIQPYLVQNQRLNNYLQQITCNLDKSCIEPMPMKCTQLFTNADSIEELTISYPLDNPILQNYLERLAISGLALRELTLTACQLNDDSSSALSKLLQTLPSLRNLNLAHNNFTSKGAEELAKGIKACVTLEELMLAHNFIELEGAKVLLKASHQHPNFKTLDLSNNWLDVTKKEFKQLNYELNPLNQSSLTHVYVTHNSIGSNQEDSENFKQIKPRNKPTKQLLLAQGIFKSELREIASCLNPDKMLKSNQWVIHLARVEGKKHAMLFIEGLRSYGQRFIQMAHFGIKGKAIVGHGEVSTQFYDIPHTLKDVAKSRYVILSWEKPRIVLKELQRKIYREENASPNYFKYDTESSYTSEQKYYNCLTWALNKLRSIDIIPERHLISYLCPTTNLVIVDHHQSSAQCIIN